MFLEKVEEAQNHILVTKYNSSQDIDAINSARIEAFEKMMKKYPEAYEKLLEMDYTDKHGRKI